MQIVNSDFTDAAKTFGGIIDYIYTYPGLRTGEFSKKFLEPSILY